MFNAEKYLIDIDVLHMKNQTKIVGSRCEVCLLVVHHYYFLIDTQHVSDLVSSIIMHIGWLKNDVLVLDNVTTCSWLSVTV